MIRAAAPRGSRWRWPRRPRWSARGRVPAPVPPQVLGQMPVHFDEIHVLRVSGRPGRAPFGRRGGQIPMMLGSTPALARTRRPRGRSPRSEANLALARTSAAPPSQMPDAFPAVTPILFEVGRQLGQGLGRGARPHVLVRAQPPSAGSSYSGSRPGKPHRQRRRCSNPQRLGSDSARHSNNRLAVIRYVSPAYRASRPWKGHSSVAKRFPRLSSKGAAGPRRRPQRAPRTT